MFNRCYVCDITNDIFLSHDHMEAERYVDKRKAARYKNSISFTKTPSGYVCHKCKKHHDLTLKGYDDVSTKRKESTKPRPLSTLHK
jgi:hypothetical protein